MHTLNEAIERLAQTAGARPAFADERQVLSFHDLECATRSVALRMLAHGARPGDHLAVLLPRSIAAILAYLGGIRAGLTVAPLSEAMVRQPAHPALTLLRPRLICCEPEQAAAVEAWVRAAPAPCAMLTDLTRPAETSEADAAAALPAPRADAPIYLNMTSGTSGASKFASTSHRQLIANTLAVRDAYPATAEDVYLCLFPSDLHPHEYFMRTLLMGCATVLVESRNPRVIIEVARRRGANWIKAAPVTLDLLAHYLQRAGAPPLPLKFLEISGVTNAEQLQRWHACFQGAFSRVWGSTETTGIAFYCGPDRLTDHARLGRLLAGYDAEAHGDDDAPLADGHTGRLNIRGAALFDGYLASADGALFGRNGAWYDTGDLVSRDADGQWYFRGRARDILKSAGRKVFLGAIEDALRAVAGVREAAVVKVADPKREELAVGFVSLTDDCAANEEALLKACRPHAPGGITPERVFILRRLPLTSGGKPDYVRLTAEAEDRWRAP